jgi:drug/metabolite transporter (DMT)-like permease
MSFLIGGILLALINLVIGKSMLFEPNLRSILLIMYLGLVVTGLAYVLYFEGMKQLTASRASIYFFLKPAIASILAYLVLQEKLGALQLAGMMLIMLALSRNILLKKA